MEYFQGEFHALALEGHPTYRVVRKIERRATYPLQIPEHARIGVLLHVDATGPDPDTDEIIGLAMLRFGYTEAGTVLGPLNVYAELRQPRKAIPKHVSRATGITPDAVKRRRMDKSEVGDFVQGADLIVCHDAIRARRICERYQPAFAHLSWACTRSQLPWGNEGVSCSELAYVAYRQGFWFDEDPTDRLHALLQILEMPLPRSGRIAMTMLAAAATQETSQVWALGAPYEVREQLRDRGYSWHGGHDGRYRAWFREVDPAKVEEELRFLDDLDVPDLAPLVTTIDATLRFSDRLF